MFLTHQNYKKVIAELIDNNESVDIAVAFWGRGAEKLLQHTTKQIRILCKLTGGGTNPEVIETLLKRGKTNGNIRIRHCDSLHAKVVLGGDSAAIGSANFSTNGLNIEDGEFDGWFEAGYLTKSKRDVETARKWFSDLWELNAEITPTLLKQAKEDWKARLKTKIDHQASRTISLASLLARDALVAIWADDASAEAKGRLHAVSSDYGDPNTLHCFEDWGRTKSGPNMQVEQTLVSVHMLNEGNKLVVEKPSSVVGVDKTRRKKTGNIMTLHIIRLEKKGLSTKDKKLLTTKIMEKRDELLGKKDYALFPLSALLK